MPGPLPVLTRSCRSPSLARPAPACQIPACPLAAGSAAQSTWLDPSVATASIQPFQGSSSQCEAKPAKILPSSSSKPGRCSSSDATNVVERWLLADPATVSGKEGCSTPVVGSILWSSKVTTPATDSSSMMKTDPVVGSTTGVEVTPRQGDRSPQPSTLEATGAPSVRCHTMAPVRGFSPATTSVSVATMSMPCEITGCASTCPPREVEKAC